MSETTTATDAAAETSDDSAENDEVAATGTTETAAGESALGDAGKKALEAMKAERKAARDEAAAAKSERDALQAKLDGKEAEHAAELKARELETAALAKANERILRSEIKAAAKGVLADPADAYQFLDLDSFEVGDDGDVNEEAIKDALAALIEKKPYLAAQSGKRFTDTADGGARNDASKPSQLSRAELAGMPPEAIEKARADGRLNDLLGIK